ncbi:MAG: LemA family protein [Gemmatimonadota bacterium]|nr:MAG: LemA family protein [Gemmatimonadota bacterium]
MWIVFVVLAIIIVIVLWFIGIYNRLVNLRNNVEASWQQIDVQLQKRYDLVPNLVETVKGYAAHEKEVFQRVTEARANCINAQGASAQGEAENMLTGALKSLFAVAEAYPDLKANQNFLMLQQELANIENKVAYSRQHYNDVVRAYNTLQQQFPANMVAGMAGSRPADYFEIEEPEAREAPKVSFE